MKSGTVYSEKGRAIRNSDNGTFIMDGGLVKIDSKKEQALDLGGNCSATINGGTIEALNENGAAIVAFGNSELTVNGGTISGYDMAISGNGNDNNGNVSITINGGDITATNGVGMYLPQQDSTTIINGGNITGSTGIEIRAANLIVNGGTITATADYYEIKKNDNGTTSKGAAIAVSQHTTKKPIMVEINEKNNIGTFCCCTDSEHLCVRFRKINQTERNGWFIHKNRIFSNTEIRRLLPLTKSKVHTQLRFERKRD